MILTKQFLITALPYARFYGGGKELTCTDEWNFYAQNKEIGAAVDTRVMKPDDLFIALPGARTDGHAFVVAALQQGASAVVVSDMTAVPVEVGQRLVVQVPDTMRALMDLARARRAQFSIPVVGITGSLGKTTTKEMVRSILNTAGVNFFASAKNQNTRISLCTNLLNMQSDVDVAVYEVSMDEAGQTRVQTDILRPTIGLITYIAGVHLAALGSLEAIAREKAELFAFMGPQDKKIIFGDQPLLREVVEGPVLTFGFELHHRVWADALQLLPPVTHFTLHSFGQQARVTLPSVHRGMLHNALAAATIAHVLGIDLSHVVQGIEQFQAHDNRFQMRPLPAERGRVISDCYNAHPVSVRAALDALEKMPNNGPKIAVLGDMLELGPEEEKLHRTVGGVFATLPSVKKLVAVGARARWIGHAVPADVQVVYAKDWQDAVHHLMPLLDEPEVLVLVKGSRGMTLEKLVAIITGTTYP